MPEQSRSPRLDANSVSLSFPLHLPSLHSFTIFHTFLFFFCIYFHHFELHEAGLACLHIQIPLFWAIHLVLEVKLYMDSQLYVKLGLY